MHHRIPVIQILHHQPVHLKDSRVGLSHIPDSLVIQLLQLADKNNTADRVVNMVPDVVDKISSFFQGDKGEKVPPAADPVPDPSL